MDFYCCRLFHFLLLIFLLLFTCILSKSNDHIFFRVINIININIIINIRRTFYLFLNKIGNHICLSAPGFLIFKMHCWIDFFSVLSCILPLFACLFQTYFSLLFSIFFYFLFVLLRYILIPISAIFSIFTFFPL